jgi:hypothetical protein
MTAGAPDNKRMKRRAIHWFIGVERSQSKGSDTTPQTESCPYGPHITLPKKVSALTPEDVQGIQWSLRRLLESLRTRPRFIQYGTMLKPGAVYEVRLTVSGDLTLLLSNVRERRSGDFRILLHRGTTKLFDADDNLPMPEKDFKEFVRHMSKTAKLRVLWKQGELDTMAGVDVKLTAWRRHLEYHLALRSKQQTCTNWSSSDSEPPESIDKENLKDAIKDRGIQAIGLGERIFRALHEYAHGSALASISLNFASVSFTLRFTGNTVSYCIDGDAAPDIFGVDTKNWQAFYDCKLATLVVFPLDGFRTTHYLEAFIWRQSTEGQA